MVALEIPLDLKIEIMTRLPAKSLMRFKCLSKLWFSLIRSRYFTNLYQIVARPRRPPRLYMSLADHFKCDTMEVFHNPINSVLVSLSSSDNGESFEEELTIPGVGGHNIDVLRGLIMYKVCKKACIYNPTTRQNVILPSVKTNIFSQEGLKKDIDYFLGHDPVLDQYILCTVSIYSEDFNRITSEHWVFVLEVGGFWKIIEFNQPHCPKEIGPCINGIICYFASTSMSSNIIVSFDFRSEEFSMIQLPDDVVPAYNEHGVLIEYGEKPAIFDYTHLSNSGVVELWVLEDGGKWSKKSLVLQPCQMHLVHDDIELMVEGTTRNGEVILSPRRLISPYYILYYDLRKNDLRKVNIIRRIPDHEFIDSYIDLPLMDMTLMDKSESIIHLEI